MYKYILVVVVDKFSLNEMNRNTDGQKNDVFFLLHINAMMCWMNEKCVVAECAGEPIVFFDKPFIIFAKTFAWNAFY